MVLLKLRKSPQTFKYQVGLKSGLPRICKSEPEYLYFKTFFLSFLFFFKLIFKYIFLVLKKNQAKNKSKESD